MNKKIIKILISVTLLISLFFFSSIVFSLFNIDINTLDNNKKYLLLFITDIMFLIILFLIYKKTLIDNFKSFFSNFLDNLEISFKYWLIGFMIMIISNLIITIVLKEGIAENEENIRLLINEIPLYMIFSVVLYAPFTEELIFRKSFKDAISNKYLYILISGITFGGLHVISYIKSPIDLLYLIPYCALGISFAYTYYKTDNIFSTISMHLIHNTFAILIYLGSALM